MLTIRIHAAECRGISIQINDKMFKENFFLDTQISKAEMETIKRYINPPNEFRPFTNSGAVSLDSVRIVL